MRRHAGRVIQNGNTGNAENYSGGSSWPSEGMEYPVSQHVIAHDFEVAPDDPVFYERRLAIEQFYVRQYAYLLQRLRDIPEGSGTVLDNTMVVWTKGMGRGHSMDRLLYMIAGGKTSRASDRVAISSQRDAAQRSSRPARELRVASSTRSANRTSANGA